MKPPVCGAVVKVFCIIILVSGSFLEMKVGLFIAHKKEEKPETLASTNNAVNSVSRLGFGVRRFDSRV